MESNKVIKLKRELLGLETQIKISEDKIKEKLEKELNLLKVCHTKLTEEIKKAEIEDLENEIIYLNNSIKDNKDDKDVKKLTSKLSKLKEKLENKKNPKPRGKQSK